MPVLETGARLGARNALIAGNDPDEARLTERFAALCDLAAPFGIAPCLEPMPWTDVRDFAQGARVLRNAAHAQLRPADRRDPFRPRRQRGQRNRRGAGGLVALRAALRRAGGASHRSCEPAAPGARRTAAARRRRPRSRRHLARTAARPAGQRRDPAWSSSRRPSRRSSAHGARSRPPHALLDRRAAGALPRPTGSRRMRGSPRETPPVAALADIEAAARNVYAAMPPTPQYAWPLLTRAPAAKSG